MYISELLAQVAHRVLPQRMQRMSDALSPRKASLLGLPSELRGHIYDELLLSDVDYTLTKHGGMFSRATFSPSEPGSLHLPWVSLLLTCRGLNTELQAYMERCKDKRPDTTKDLRTYVSDAKFSERDLKSVTWRRLPCAPTQVKRIIVHSTIPDRVQWGGDGGPGQPANSLWYLLNNTLHHGPRLGGAGLSKHVHVQVVELHIERKDAVDDIPSRPRGYIQSWLGAMCSPGFLCGYVDKFVVCREDKRIEIVPNQNKSATPPEEWARWGFHWGVPPMKDREKELRSLLLDCQPWNNNAT